MGEAVSAVTTVERTVPEKILLAAFELEEQGQSPFSAEALIVAAWQKFPRTFGLKGYADLYPDSNKVLTSIMGEKGLARKGWLVKMGQKLYSLTREGRGAVKGLGGEAPRRITEPVAAAAKLTKDQEKFLLSLFNSTAVQKYQEGLKPELTFADALKFWGLSENIHGSALDTRLDKLRSTVAEVETVVTGADMVLSNGRSVSLADVNLLSRVDEYLMERFSRHLTLLRNRGGKP
jgi:hypothetical protein